MLLHGESFRWRFSGRRRNSAATLLVCCLLDIGQLLCFYRLLLAIFVESSEFFRDLLGFKYIVAFYHVVGVG